MSQRWPPESCSRVAVWQIQRHPLLSLGSPLFATTDCHFDKLHTQRGHPPTTFISDLLLDAMLILQSPSKRRPVAALLPNQGLEETGANIDQRASAGQIHLLSTYIDKLNLKSSARFAKTETEAK